MLEAKKLEFTSLSEMLFFVRRRKVLSGILNSLAAVLMDVFSFTTFEALRRSSSVKFPLVVVTQRVLHAPPISGLQSQPKIKLDLSKRSNNVTFHATVCLASVKNGCYKNQYDVVYQLT
jgi:hypothetical protein